MLELRDQTGKRKTRCKMKLNEMKENETRRNKKLKYLRK